MITERILHPLRAFAVGTALACALTAQAPMAPGTHARALITQTIDDSHLVPLATQPGLSITAANDRGRVKDDVTLDDMVLVLRRPAEQETALEAFLAEQSDPGSPNYHHWLTAADYGSRFGLAQQDLATIREWLESSGFTVNTIYANGVLVDFSGTAGQVRAAFHIEIHQVDANGRRVLVGSPSPRIPAALAPAIAGVACLNDSQAHPAKAPGTIQVAALSTDRAY